MPPKESSKNANNKDDITTTGARTRETDEDGVIIREKSRLNEALNETLVNRPLD